MSLDIQDIREVLKRELNDLKREVADEVVNDSRFRDLAAKVDKIENLVDTEIQELKHMLEKQLEGSPR